MAASMCLSGSMALRLLFRSLKSACRAENSLQCGAHTKYLSTVSSSSSSSSSSDSSDSSDSDQEEAKTDERNAALDKLKSLLSEMKIESIPSSDPSSLSFKLAKPGLPRKPALKEKAEKTKGLEEEIVKAAKEVATSFGGDVERTESELLTELRLHAQEKKEGGDLAEKSRPSISELFVGMKIDRKSRRRESRVDRGESIETAFVHGDLRPGTIDALVEAVSRERKTGRKEVAAGGAPEQVDLKSLARLNIFSPDAEENKDAPQLETWDRLQARELRLLVTPPPKNAYEEMILWTEQGKLWTFPINNEAGMDEEAKVSFQEHVFLDSLIEDFPKKGPIRHFMELVITGLSKNPYISAQRKRDHIDWFRNYFREKEAVLKAAGAITE